MWHCVVKSELFIKQQNFRLIQIEVICRRQYKCDSEIEINFKRIENNVGNRENGGYQHFLLFPQCFQKTFFFGLVTNMDWVIKGSYTFQDVSA